MQKRTLVSYSTRDPEYATLDDEGLFKKVPYASGAILRELKNLGWKNRRLTWKQTRNPLVFRRHLMEFKPDLILAYGATGETPYWARRLCSWRGPIIHCWDDYYAEIWESAFGKLAGWFMRYYEKRIIQHSDAVITLSYYNLRRAQECGIPAWYVPNGCDDVPAYNPTQSSVRLEGRFNVLYTGSQSRYKRVHELAEAMKRLPKEIKLYLTGNPYPHMRKYASENVIFLGFLPREELWSVMHQADVLANTSDQDCSLKFHEYIRLRKPILAYDGRANLLFKNRVNALLTRDYAAAILELYNSPELRQRLVDNAARDIPVHTWREIAEQVDRTLAEICENYRRRGMNDK